jgi:hypothetical protein
MPLKWARSSNGARQIRIRMRRKGRGAISYRWRRLTNEGWWVVMTRTMRKRLTMMTRV